MASPAVLLDLKRIRENTTAKWAFRLLDDIRAAQAANEEDKDDDDDDDDDEDEEGEADDDDEGDSEEARQRRLQKQQARCVSVCLSVCTGYRYTHADTYNI